MLNYLLKTQALLMDYLNRVVQYIYLEVIIFYLKFIASNMTILSCSFTNNWAALSGGAIYATGFKFINI